MRSHRILTLIAVLLAVCLLFTACSGDGSGVKRNYFLVILLFLLSGAGIYFSWLAKKQEEARERRKKQRAAQRANRTE